MRKTKEIIGLVLIAVVLLCGCGRDGRDAFGQEGKNDLQDESMSEEPYIEEFENASIEYEKFNSPAEENGLADTHIYVEGTVLRQEVMENDDEKSSLVAPEYRMLTIKQRDGNKWLIGLPSETKIKGIKNKYIRAFGMYQGFSDVKDMPALFIASQDEDFIGNARIDVDDDGEYRTVYSYYDWVLKKMDEEDENLDGESRESKPEEPAVKSTETPEPNSDIAIGKRNALKSALQYLSHSSFSRNGLVGQLEYEGYTNEESTYAVDNCGADWNEQALKSANSYLSRSSFSHQGLIDQLVYEGFTEEQATYGADNCGANWNEQAAKSAGQYLSHSAFSREGLIGQLQYEGFTIEQATYGVEANGY